MSQNLIVYYSRTGTARQVAEAIAGHTGWILAEVSDRQPRAGLWGDLRCVWDMLLYRMPAHEYAGPDPVVCEHVLVIAPVWLGRLAAPMRSFLRDHAPVRGALSAICVMAARGGFRAEEDIARLTGKTPEPAVVLRQQDVLSGQAGNAIAEFASAMTSRHSGTEPMLRPVWISPKEV